MRPGDLVSILSMFWIHGVSCDVQSAIALWVDSDLVWDLVEWVAAASRSHMVVLKLVLLFATRSKPSLWL
jgi:hypothetical protein